MVKRPGAYGKDEVADMMEANCPIENRIRRIVPVKTRMNLRTPVKVGCLLGAGALLLIPRTVELAPADVPWPAQTWSAGQDITTGPAQHMDLSGACYNATLGYVLALRQDNLVWRYDYNPGAQTWTAGPPITLPISGDFEGLTQFDESDDPVDGARILLLHEGSGGGHNDSFVYLIRRLFTVPAVARTWRVGCASGCPMPGEVNNADGPEGIAFVPNAWLAARGFVDGQGQPRLGTPREAGGLGGLVFIGHQAGGFVYVFDLRTTADHALTFVGAFDTGSSLNEIAALEFDATNGLLYLFHGAGINRLEVTDLSSMPGGGGADRVFNTLALTAPADAGSGLNLEGLAVIPPDMCRAHDACAEPPETMEGSLFLTCDGCVPAIKWLRGLSGGWISECPPGCAEGIPGDVNCDGTADGRDIGRFAELAASGSYWCQVDMDGDRETGGDDVTLFVQALIGSG